MAALQIGYGAVNGRLLRNAVHDSPYGIGLWGDSAHPTTGITASGNIGYNNSEFDFYEYGPEHQGCRLDRGQSGTLGRVRILAGRSILTPHASTFLQLSNRILRFRDSRLSLECHGFHLSKRRCSNSSWPFHRPMSTA